MNDNAAGSKMARRLFPLVLAVTCTRGDAWARAEQRPRAASVPASVGARPGASAAKADGDGVVKLPVAGLARLQPARVI